MEAAATCAAVGDDLPCKGDDDDLGLADLFAVPDGSDVKHVVLEVCKYATRAVVGMDERVPVQGPVDEDEEDGPVDEDEDEDGPVLEEVDRDDTDLGEVDQEEEPNARDLTIQSVPNIVHNPMQSMDSYRDALVNANLEDVLDAACTFVADGMHLIYPDDFSKLARFARFARLLQDCPVDNFHTHDDEPDPDFPGDLPPANSRRLNLPILDYYSPFDDPRLDLFEGYDNPNPWTKVVSKKKGRNDKSIKSSGCGAELYPVDGRSRVNSSSLELVKCPAPPEIASAAAATTSSEIKTFDESLPSTTLQIRYADGSRVVEIFNTTQTVGDIRAFVDATRPGGGTRFTLQAGFPPVILDDASMTIEEAGLGKSVIFERM